MGQETMESKPPPTEQDFAIDRFEKAEQIRRFEIELLWKRSTFFWGFLISSFAAYALFLKSEEETSTMMAMLIACFGITASFVWYLANRAGGYWQKVWEKKLLEDENSALGKPFYADLPPDNIFVNPHYWYLDPRRCSLHRLATGFSLYALVFWVVLAAVPAIELAASRYSDSHGLKFWLPLIVLFLSVLYMRHLFTASLDHGPKESSAGTSTSASTQSTPNLSSSRENDAHPN